MSDIRNELIGQYERALEAYIQGAGESALASAYELGRRLIAEGKTTKEIAALLGIMRNTAESHEKGT